MDPVATVQSLTTACIMAGLGDEHAATSLGPCGPSDVLRLLGELTERWRAELPPTADALRLAATHTDPEIAAELGMSVHTVRDIRRRHGMVRGRRVAAPEPAWVSRVRDMHERGLSREQMGAETGWAPATVYQRLSKLRLLGAP